MKYFYACETQDEAKKLYRQLAMQHHPDKGGSTQVMQEINIEYAEYLQRSGYDFRNFSKDFSNDEVFREFDEFVRSNPKLALFLTAGVIILAIGNVIFKKTKFAK